MSAAPSVAVPLVRRPWCGSAVLGVAAGWLAHVAVDRVAGYDLRDRHGAIRR